MNQKYVDEGICRFTGDSPKYPSYNRRNIMLGFVIEDINRDDTINAIAQIHKARLDAITVQNITVIKGTEEYSLCESEYINGLVLGHIFYDISGTIAV